MALKEIDFSLYVYDTNFQNYLSNRFQFVCVNEIASNKQKVTCGVPQGSIGFLKND